MGSRAQGSWHHTRSWTAVLLLSVASWLIPATSAMAEDCVADLGGVLDGNVMPTPPSQVQVDGNCRVLNYPASNPLTTNFSFLTQPGQQDDRWLVIFDNVVHTGNMSCDATHDHKIWLTNSSSTTIQDGCQNYLIPVEKIDKQNPAGNTATVGVPFTYRLVVPVLFDPATGNVIDFAGSPNQLHGITITDDLNETGVDLTYVSHTAYWEDSGTPVPHTFSNTGGILRFDDIPIVPAEEQFIIEITVVLEDTPANAIGTQFINIARWDFGRLIDDVFYEPLPGEWGISPPMTIVAPNLVMTKTGPATMNLGPYGQFTLDVHNTGLGGAWNATILDRLPDGPSGGMCDLQPEILGVTLAGSPVAAGTGYTLAWTGAPACELSVTLTDAAGPIGPDQHLVVTYQTKVDADTPDGATLTNVAGATQWFNGDSAQVDRIVSTRTLTDGTEGTLDHEDSHTVSVAVLGYFFEKSVANLRSGEDPASLAVPGDMLRYTLRVRTTTDPLANFRILDEIDALNTPGAFVPGSLVLVGALPPGAVNATNPTGGAKGTGLIDISNLNLAAGSELVIQFDVAVIPGVALGTIITNQSRLLVNGSPFMLSDDPNVNGQADPFVAGDEDPTRVPVVLPTLVFQKTVLTGATATPGDVVRYRVAITNVSNVPLTGFALVDQIDGLNGSPWFEPGTLTLVTALPQGTTNATTPTGGSAGTGLVDLRNLSLGVAGSATESLVVEFTVQLKPVIANGTVVLNQAGIYLAGTQMSLSDDPALGGATDPTRLVIQSAPAFQVLKTSLDVTGDPAVLRAGDTLRYTITVKNVGTASATDAILRDQVPVNTLYVPGSTTLNGTAVADVGGTTPLAGGLALYAPEDPTPGAMRADATATTANVATITFDVVVDPDVVDGTIISNQGFVSAAAGGVVDTPSDDPDTEVLNDPTRDIVGYLPLLFADKRAVLQVDLGSPGVVDPGDVLRYTITVYNTGTVPATGVVLRDAVPANTTYVADTTTLNGLAVGQPDGGLSPLAAGVPLSSSDLTPPLPGAGQGTLTPGGSAVLEFDLQVDANVAAGTLIVNQAVVDTVEVNDLLTDGDGNPATGPEPTVVVVGSGQQLAITKQVAVVGGGPALAGSTLEYVVLVTNIGSVPAQYVVITDDLAVPFPGYLAYVDQSATLNGNTAGVTVNGTLLTADYAATYGPLAPGGTALLRFRAVIDANLAIGTTVTNTGIVTWNNPPQTLMASVAIDVGGMVGVGTLNGTAWHDADFDQALDPAERLLADWTVELWRNGTLAHTTRTDAAGTYRISGVVPNYATTDTYELRFSAPGAGGSSAKLGRAASDFTNDLQRIADIVVQMGDNLLSLNLPISPNGVVYNTLSRAPIPGATLRMLSATTGQGLPPGCFYDPVQQGQVTLADGWYRFDMSFGDALCPSGGAYLLEATAPVTGYIAGVSEINPPASDGSTAPLSVPTCPGGPNDAVPATASHCEVQVQEVAPPQAVAPRTPGTTYHLHLALDDSLVPGSSQVFNNHIPIDPDLQGALAITKTTPMLNVSRGQLVPYTITFTNVTEVPLFEVTLVDRYPAGFKYVEGSARLDGVPLEPTVSGRELTWPGLSIAGNGRRTAVLLLAVGAGVGEGEFVNRAQAVQGFTGDPLSGIATATVRVIPDATFDCTDVTGKVYADANRNGVQDDDEPGIGGVRLVTARGLNATTDAHGRYHITCAITPNESRGSNFVLKLDDRTLPSGFRESTPPVRIARATRGKALRINFGASIHRVIGLDVADAVFEPGTTDMRPQWKPRMDLLLDELRKSPATLRLSYLADIEDEDLVQRRLAAIRSEVMARWKALDCCYELRVEEDVFWRLGGPPRPAPIGRAAESKGVRQ